MQMLCQVRGMHEWLFSAILLPAQLRRVLFWGKFCRFLGAFRQILTIEIGNTIEAVMMAPTRRHLMVA
jgi:hypothetical protein